MSSLITVKEASQFTLRNALAVIVARYKKRTEGYATLGAFVEGVLIEARLHPNKPRAQPFQELKQAEWRGAYDERQRVVRFLEKKSRELGGLSGLLLGNLSTVIDDGDHDTEGGAANA